MVGHAQLARKPPAAVPEGAVADQFLTFQNRNFRHIFSMTVEPRIVFQLVVWVAQYIAAFFKDQIQGLTANPRVTTFGARSPRPDRVS